MRKSASRIEYSRSQGPLDVGETRILFKFVLCIGIWLLLVQPQRTAPCPLCALCLSVLSLLLRILSLSLSLSLSLPLPSLAAPADHTRMHAASSIHPEPPVRKDCKKERQRAAAARRLNRRPASPTFRPRPAPAASSAQAPPHTAFAPCRHRPRSLPSCPRQLAAAPAAATAAAATTATAARCPPAAVEQMLSCRSPPRQPTSHRAAAAAAAATCRLPPLTTPARRSRLK